MHPDTLPDAPHGRGAHSDAVARWYALRTRSRFEFAVREGLRAAGIEEYLPVHTIETREAGRTQLTKLPIFPGYIFARFVAAREALVVLRTRGVVEILGAAGVPIAIPDEEIANLRSFAGYSRPVKVTRCVPGAVVRVKRGPFAGVAGVVKRVKGAATLTVSVPMLGRAVSVEIDAADLD
jgi:transcription antitermination factor NusG